MSSAKKIGLTIFLVIIAMQFIRPARNSSNTVSGTDMVTQFNTPANVAGILKTSCYDCHSDNTRYPWYSNVQPVAWFLAKHISNGKEELNFNQFTTYSHRRQISKLKSIQNSVKDGSMPLSSYKMLHNDAKLDDNKRRILIDWIIRTKDSLDR